MQNIKIGDLVLIHGEVARVDFVNERELFYSTKGGELIRYGFELPIEAQPKQIWILEQ